MIDILVTFISISLRNIWRNRQRSLFTVVSLSIGILSASFLTAIQRGSRAQLETDAVQNLLGHISMANENYYDDHVALFSVPELTDPERTALNSLEVVHLIERLRISSIAMSERETVPLELVGISPEEEEGYSFIGVSDNSIIQGKYLSGVNDDGIILGKRLIDELKTQIGQRIVILVQNSEGSSVERGFRIIGAYSHELQSVEKSYGFTGRASLQKLLGLSGRVSEQSIFISNKQEAEKLASMYQELFFDRSVRSWIEREPFLRAVVKLQSGVMLIWYGVVLIAVLFGVLNTLFMAVYEREKEFCLYQALGMNSRLVILQVVIETFILLCVGSMAGVLLCSGVIGFISVKGIPLNYFSDGVHLIGMRSVIYPVLSFIDVLTFIFMIILICLIGSLFPAHRASRISPVMGLTK